MVLRKRLIASLTTGLLPLLTASLSHALIIQPVQVKSAIGEPFYAEIAISDLGASSLQDISVGMATPQELSGLGIHAASTADLHFSLQQRSGSQSVIIVSGSQPVNDPFLEFVLKVKSGNNVRLQRVSALLDPKDSNKQPLAPAIKTQFASDDGFVQLAASSAPPVDLGVSSGRTYSETSNSTVQGSEQPLVVLNSLPPDMQPDTGTQAAAASGSNTTPDTTIAIPKEIEVSTKASEQGQHVVRKNESLWKIAKQLAPQMNQPVDQVMKTIREMNKDAFIDGNPNQLRRGATIVLPERDQNTTLVNRALPAPGPVDNNKPLKAMSSQGKKTVKRSGVLPKAELTIIAPTANGVALGNSNKGRTSGSQPLSRELSQKLGDERRKTVSMQQEVSALDTQLTLNDKKIAMLNAKLAEMEQQLKMRNQKQKATKQTSTTQKALHAAAPVIAMAALALSGFSPNVAYAAEGDSGGFPTWIILAAIIAIAAIAFLLMRGKAEDKKKAAAKNKRPVARSTAKPAVPEAAAPQPRPVSPAPVAQTPVERKPAAPVETDVLHEVQSYIERERYPQALSLLKEAVGKTPQRIDLQVKILEIYALLNDTTAFNSQKKLVDNFNQPEASAHAEKLQQLLVVEQPKPEVEKSDTIEFTPSFTQQDQVEPLGEEEHSFFADDLSQQSGKAAPATSADQSLEALEAEFGFLDSTPAPAKSPAPAARQDNSLDFSLDSTPAAAPAASEQEAPLDLEFDVSDAFTLEEVKPAPHLVEPLAFKQEAPASQPEEKTDSNLDGISLQDTNWAEGFDDLEFDVGTVPAAATPATPVTPAPIQPAAEIAETSFSSDDPEDFLLKEFPFLVNIDVQQTNLELAESYINLGEARSARELLSEVINLGTSQQKAQAQHLLQNLPS